MEGAFNIIFNHSKYCKINFSNAGVNSSVEQTFSAWENILDQTNLNMSLESVKAQACLDDWTKTVLRQPRNHAGTK